MWLVCDYRPSFYSASHLNLKLNLFFLDSKLDSATSIIGHRKIKKLISKLMYDNDPLPLCLWWITIAKQKARVHKTKHHTDTSGSKTTE